jgi:hypothetical protein
VLLPLPFRRELNELFRKDRRVFLKIVGGMFVGAFVAVGAVGKLADIVAALFIAAAALVGGLAVCALGLKDVVHRRIGAGEPTNVLLRVYLTSGKISLVLWLTTAVLCTIVATYLALS